MDTFGILSILPPVIAIFLAIKTRQVYFSLIFGIWIGWIIISGWNFFDGSVAAIEAIVNVFKSAGNTRTIIFSCLVGSLITLIQKSGGVEGFIIWINKTLAKIEEKKEGKSRTIIQIYAWLTGILIFVETNISVLTVGSIFRPIFDKKSIPREKLAYIVDSSSAPICVLVPFNAWGAYLIGLIAAQSIGNPFEVLINSIVYNFYPILAVIFVFIIIKSNFNFGPMKRAEERASKTGKVIADGSTPMISDEITMLNSKEGIKAKSLNMIIPILTMVISMPLFLIITGWNQNNFEATATFIQKVSSSISNGSGSSAVLYSVILATTTASIMYFAQKIFNLKEVSELWLKGISGLIPLAFLMLLAFAIGDVCKELETGQYIADISKGLLSPGFVPMILFIISCFIAFSTGTSWGTFAIMISIGIPLSQTLDANIYMSIAAILGGGVFGDHCSPISDTTIVSSMASACDHIDHVKTQLPYALFVGGITSTLYLLMGLFS